MKRSEPSTPLREESPSFSLCALEEEMLLRSQLPGVVVHDLSTEIRMAHLGLLRAIDMGIEQAAGSISRMTQVLCNLIQLHIYGGELHSRETVGIEELLRREEIELQLPADAPVSELFSLLASNESVLSSVPEVFRGSILAQRHIIEKILVLRKTVAQALFVIAMAEANRERRMQHFLSQVPRRKQ